VIGTGRHAAFAHRRQVVVRQHDDPDVIPVVRLGIAGAGRADHADAAAGPELHIHDDDVVGNRIELLDGFGFR
jgi:hypothetical protein